MQPAVVTTRLIEIWTRLPIRARIRTRKLAYLHFLIELVELLLKLAMISKRPLSNFWFGLENELDYVCIRMQIQIHLRWNIDDQEVGQLLIGRLGVLTHG